MKLVTFFSSRFTYRRRMFADPLGLAPLTLSFLLVITVLDYF
jgi:hypothetical protein